MATIAAAQAVLTILGERSLPSKPTRREPCRVRRATACERPSAKASSAKASLIAGRTASTPRVVTDRQPGRLPSPHCSSPTALPKAFPPDGFTRCR